MILSIHTIHEKHCFFFSSNAFFTCILFICHNNSCQITCTHVPLMMSINNRLRSPLLLLYLVFASVVVAAQENVSELYLTILFSVLWRWWLMWFFQDMYIVFLRDEASGERLLETHHSVLSSLKGRFATIPASPSSFRPRDCGKKARFWVFVSLTLVVFLCSENDASESLVYSYTKIFNAFAAKLSQDEARKLSSM